mmetsp:Transcript_5435/g.11181  ORF Transcript_5435/g.11181 Transcript_5435/m.11181 type:complete len:368 (+) Transcript_5435:142-1245(+)
MTGKAWDGKAPAGPVLGTMNWGFEAQVSQEVAGEMLAEYVKVCEEMGYDIILDTARVYQLGQTEEIIGNLLQENDKPWSGKKIQVHTKASPPVGPLSKSGVREQLEASLKALKMDCVDVYYLHQPDMRVDIEETLEVCNELHKEGKFKELGVSVFAAWDVVRCVTLCREKGWVEPTVYQGLYNPISRGLDPELFPAVRSYKLRVYIFNPLAGGLLTGRYASVEDIKGATEGRFSSEFDFVPKSQEHSFKGYGAKAYQGLYGRDEMFSALQLLVDECGRDNMVEKTISWLRFCSYLSSPDGIIFGASKTAHVKSNLIAFSEGKPLSEKEQAAFATAARLSKPFQPGYTRGYGSLPGTEDIIMKKFKDN